MPENLPDDAVSPPEDATETIPALDMDLMDDMMSLLQESQQVFLSTPGYAQDLPEAVPDVSVEEDVAPAVFAMLEDMSAPPDALPLQRAAEPADLMALFQAGGESALALMQYCVRSRHFDPLFMLLVKEYQLRPTHVAALALYDCFCTPQAQARLSIHTVLQAHEMRLRQQMEVVRAQWQQISAPPVAEPDAAPAGVRITVPYRSLFDFLLTAIVQAEDGSWQRAAREYDPGRSVSQNLPGGDMSPAQRLFVTRIWLPVLRPRLVAAGFWKLATVE